MNKNRQKRQVLKAKISQVLSEEVKDLPIQVQDILMDDLLTAFENRLTALRRAKPTIEYAMIVGLEVPQ